VFTTDALLKGVEQKVEIAVYFKTEPADPAPEQMTALQTEIASWTEVKGCVFVSKEEALERIKEWYKDTPEVYESLTSNPLPNSLEVSLIDPQAVHDVAARIEAQDPERTILDEVRFGEKVADKLFNLTSHLRNIMLGFIVLWAWWPYC